ncbi:carbohydrate-binding protein [Cellvibrio mixtus]|uniref:carbohydrate-binding protein n=1 Tax=Cellvibrio mixtus TaxID=39650 RepID=UPI000586EB8E|nr:carbohydrate-binding protein [Cellvibrio mixtus]
MNNNFFSRKRAAYQHKAILTSFLKISALAGIGLLSGIAMADVAPLSVSGNKILAGNQVASFAGNSLFWSNNGWGGEKYYNADAVRWLKTDWGSNLVRAAMGVEEGGGYLQDPTGNKNKVKAVVDAAIANDMYVIIDWHTHHAEQYTAQSIAFFQEMARTYGNKNHVIYEVYNEPLDTASWSGVIKPYAQQVVNAIRAIDPDNLIIVGTRTWSQRVDEAARDPIAGNNIAYTLHFYAGSHGQPIRDFAQTALDNNAAIFVTEWGSVNANGDGGVNYGETNAWVDFMKRNNISHANWALNDKAEGSSSLVPGASAGGGWASSQLTASGAFAKDIIRNWPSPSGPVDPTPTCTTSNVSETIQAESYCQADGIQTEGTTDVGGGQNVGYIDSNDWMTYAVNIPVTGTYKVSYRVAAPAGGSQFKLEKAGGSPVYGSINVPTTGGWQNWQTVSHNVVLPAGEQLIAISAITGGFNVNWLKVESVDNTNPGTVIATLQAEDFSQQQGTQTENTTDTGGGKNVGYIDAGDWLSYAGTPINIPSTGNYVIEYRVASQSGGGSLTFEEAGGSPVYGTLAIPGTGGWQNWTTIKHTVNLGAGSHKFGIKVNAGGWNINWIRISKVN